MADRVCDGRCHDAESRSCTCWCEGLFHGSAGDFARREFLKAMGIKEIPKTERERDILLAQPDLYEGDMRRKWAKAWRKAKAERRRVDRIYAGHEH